MGVLGVWPGWVRDLRLRPSRGGGVAGVWVSAHGDERAVVVRVRWWLPVQQVVSAHPSAQCRPWLIRLRRLRAAVRRLSQALLGCTPW